MPYLKGRGAQINTPNPYDKLVYDEQPIDWAAGEEAELRTEYINVHPKTMVNKVDSLDIPLDYSMNPYQGCEHGCVYCYARNTHPYWGYSAGLDFEQKILIKQDAAALLEKKLRSPRWEAAPIMLAGNTDCYQPIEQKLEITRSLLKIFWRYRHPVSIITKNKLILRDLDLLRPLAEQRLLRVAISVTTLDEDLRRMMEPRTASVKQRLRTIRELSEAGVPVTAMLAPIIPGLNEHEIFPLMEAVAEAGARSAGYTLVRLNGDIGRIFEDWIRKHLPDRADKVLNRIRETHDGSLEEKRWGKRMRGEGVYADMVSLQFKMARERYLKTRSLPDYNLELHRQYKSDQLSLF